MSYITTWITVLLSVHVFWVFFRFMVSSFQRRGLDPYKPDTCVALGSLTSNPYMKANRGPFTLENSAVRAKVYRCDSFKDKLRVQILILWWTC